MENIPKPTESELEILQILWQKGKATVKEVNDFLNTFKETGYTTTLKLMQIMHEKSLVARDISLRQHVYQASVTESDIQKGMLKRFIDATFQGDAMNLVMQALGNNKTSDEELKQLKDFINQLENKTTEQ